MSIKNTIRRITKQLAREGHINADHEGTMMMVSIGDKGYANKWPQRPFHQKNGSMRKKRRIHNAVINAFKENEVAIYTGVIPTNVGPMTISEDGLVNVEMNFDYATAVVNHNADVMQAVVEEKIKALHTDHAPALVDIPGVWPSPLHFGKMDYKPEAVQVLPVKNDSGRPLIVVPAEQRNSTFNETMIISRGVNDPNPIVTRNGVPVTGSPLEALIASPEFDAAVNQPIQTIIAVDPGSDYYPDRAVSAEYAHDPVTGELKLRQVSIVPPGEGLPMLPIEAGGVPPKGEYLYQALGGPDVPDGERDYFNIWTTGTTPDPLQAEYDRDMERPVDFKPEPSFKEDFTPGTESTSLADKINALSNGVTSAQEERVARIHAQADADIASINASLNMEPYKLAEDLPEVGDKSKFYYVFELGMFFHWDGENYMPIQPSSREGGVLVKEMFPDTEQKVQDELADTHQADRRSWGRKLWDLFVGKDRG